MNLIDFIISLILLAFGSVFLFFIGKILMAQVRIILRATQEKTKLRKVSGKLERIDDLIEKNSYTQALRELEGGFILKQLPTRSLIILAKKHNQNMLSRCLIVAEEHECKTNNLVTVEKLLSSYTELQLQLLKANEAFNAFKTRRKSSGKKTPSWGSNEFKNKITSLRTEVNQTRITLQKELSILFDAVRSPETGSDIVYH